MTKTVEYFIDIGPGWQDVQFAPWPWSAQGGNAPLDLPSGFRRIRVLVELPCIGGAALADATVQAKVEETT